MMPSELMQAQTPGAKAASQVTPGLEARPWEKVRGCRGWGPHQKWPKTGGGFELYCFYW